MVTIISGTNRKGSFSRRVANLYSSLLKERGIESNIIDLKHLPKDFVYSLYEDDKIPHQDFVDMQALISASSKFVFVVPEYNGSFPGILKSFIDGLNFPNSFRGKYAALIGISSGTQGSSLAMSHLTDILNYVGVFVLPIKPRMVGIESHFKDNEITNKFYLDLLNLQIDQLLKINTKES
ncbi:MAG: NAD(P)H-dependent oxidoreductase [Bacteroidetes bacterium]|nr:NAD(P)H-dependent oxidoreductase [Bacteroidota bacterium]